MFHWQGWQRSDKVLSPVTSEWQSFITVMLTPLKVSTKKWEHYKSDKDFSRTRSLLYFTICHISVIIWFSYVTLLCHPCRWVVIGAQDVMLYNPGWKRSIKTGFVIEKCDAQKIQHFWRSIQLSLHLRVIIGSLACCYHFTSVLFSFYKWAIIISQACYYRFSSVLLFCNFVLLFTIKSLGYVIIIKRLHVTTIRKLCYYWYTWLLNT